MIGAAVLVALVVLVVTPGVIMRLHDIRRERS